MPRIINCLVAVECEDEEALGLFQKYCADVMDHAARAAVEALGHDTIRLVADIRVGEEVPMEDDGLHQ